MSDTQSIRILHFSDFHLDKMHENDANILLSNMIEAIQQKKEQIDLVVFSGDMIDKGGRNYGNITNAFEKFKELVIERICNELNIDKERFMFTPGNHDIEGSKISAMADIGINMTLMNEERVHEYIKSSEFNNEYPGRIESFKNFEKTYYQDFKNGEFKYHYDLFCSNYVYSIKGKKIGVSSLNTVWRCDEKNSNHIILGLDQITNSHEYLRDCDVKIAVTHYGYDFLLEWEKKKAKEMIAENYDVLFTGHSHSDDYERIELPNGKTCLHLKSAGTLDNNRYETDENYKNGFQIITYYPNDHLEIVVYYQRNGQYFKQDLNYGDPSTPGLCRWNFQNKTENIETSHEVIDDSCTYDPLVLKQELLDKMLEIKKGHPSYKLLADNNYSVRPSLYPKIKDEKDPLYRVIQKYRNNEKKNHLILEGKGGIGKSIALLNIYTTNVSCRDYSIFIPLKDLSYNDSNKKTISYPITYYINNLFPEWKEAIEQKAREPWNRSPSLTLLLDGLNEIPSKYYEIVKRDIEKWAKYDGIQLVMTSRPDSRNFDFNKKDGYELLTLDDLDKNMVLSFLQDMEAAIPLDDDPIWKIINNPLMLNLYYKGQKLNNTNNTKQGASEGVVIWNYLQYEFEKHQSASTYGKAALLYIAPYIAYYMLENRDYYVDSDKFDLLGDRAIQRVWKRISSTSTTPDWNTEIKPLLTTIYNLFVFQELTNNGQYELMHQQLRDALAAIHLMNVIDLNNDSIPDEWKKPIGVFVMTHIADLIAQRQADKIWELNRNHPSGEEATINVLDLQWHRLGGDLSGLDFSTLDLSKIPLWPYRVPNGLRLNLPTEANKLANTKFSENSFLFINEDIKGRKNAGSGRIVASAATPDGRYIVSGSWDNVLQVWNADSGHPLHVLKGHNSQVCTVAVNEKWCVSGSFDETIIVWDQEDWKLKVKSDIIPLPIELKFSDRDHNIVNAVCLSKIDLVTETCLCFSGWSDGHVRIWQIKHNKLELIKDLKPDLEKIRDLANYEERKKKGKEFRVISLAITSDEKYCVIRRANNNIYIWDWRNEDPESQTVIWDWQNDESNPNIRKIESDSSLVCGLAVYGNTCVFSESVRSEPSRLWCMDVSNANSKDDAVQFEGQHDSLIDSVAISPDGKYVISGSWDLTVRIWSMETKKCLHVLKGHTRRIQTVTVSSDGRFVYSGSRDRTIKVWDIVNGNCLLTILASSHQWISAMDAVGDGLCVFGCEDGSIRLWDTKAGKCLKVFPTDGGLTTVATARIGERLFCISGDNDGQIIKWDLESNTGDKKIIGTVDSSITCISVEQQQFAVGMQNGKIKILCLEDDSLATPLKELKEFVHGHDWVNVVRLKNGKCYSGSSDRTIKAWNVNDGCELFPPIKDTIIKGRVQSLDVTPDGQWIISGEGEPEIKDRFPHKTMQIWTKNQNNQQERWSNIGDGFYGTWKGDNPIAITDNNNVIIQQIKTIDENSRVNCPVLKQYGIFSHKQTMGTKYIKLNSWLSVMAFDNNKGCFFGTNKGYVGHWADTTKQKFDKWPVLMDFDVVGVNFSKADINDDLRNFLHVNGAKTHDEEYNVPIN